MHRHFEELCVLAATGQISPEDRAQLDEHIRCCSACSDFLSDIGPLHAPIASALLDGLPEMLEVPEGIRERFLRSASAQGLHLSIGPALASSAGTGGAQRTKSRMKNEAGSRFVPWLWTGLSARLALTLAAACICIAMGYGLAWWRLTSFAGSFSGAGIAAPSVVPMSPANPQSGHGPLAATSTHTLEALATLDAEHLKKLDAELAEVSAQKEKLAHTADALRQQVATSSDLEAAFKAAQQETDAAQRQAASLRLERDALVREVASLNLSLAAEKNSAHEAGEQVAAMTEQLERRRQMSESIGQAQDMISSRNLHIIDVYDTDASSKQRRLSGRVFYVEGKSLVFYAYDLPDGKRKGHDQVFRVWGETAGVDNTSFQLGIMSRDKSGESRWVLSFDDPKVLNRINAVYVSNDPPSQAQDNPHRLMYAYLGSANHP